MSFALDESMRRVCLFWLALMLWASPSSARQISPGSTRTRVPAVGQQTEYSCGAASLRAVLRRRGRSVSEPRLRRILRTSSAYGTHPDDIVAVAPRFKLRATVKERTTIPALARALAAGKDVMINLQAWPDKSPRSRAAWRNHWDDGHWVVLESVKADGTVCFMDPWVVRQQKPGRVRGGDAGRFVLGRKDFLARWHDHFVEKTPDRRYVSPPTRRQYQRMAVILE